MPNQKVVLIRGPLAVGKSTLAANLQRALAPCALIEVDKLRRMPSDGDLSDRHLSLAKENACLLAQRFLSEGYSVIIESVFQANYYLELVWRNLYSIGIPIHLVTLEANLDILYSRDAKKTQPNYDRVEEVYRRLATADTQRGLIINTNQLEAEAVCAEVIARLEAGEG